MSESDNGIHFPTTSDKTAVAKTQGRVKWFNNKSGYGFITVTSGEQSGNDIFVHHSSIKVEKEQYRYLVQGEYVEFSINEVSDSEHKWHAADVGGIACGKLMCETRLTARLSRMETSETSQKESPSPTHKPQRSSYRVRPHGPGPREGDEWMLVRRRSGARSEQPTMRTRPSRSTKD